MTNSPCISYRFVSVSLGETIVPGRSELLKDEIGQPQSPQGSLLPSDLSSCHGVIDAQHAGLQ